MEKHRAAIGEYGDHRFRGYLQGNVLDRSLGDEEKVDAIRGDPGVEEVVEVNKKMLKRARMMDRFVATEVCKMPTLDPLIFARYRNTIIKCVGRGQGPGYSVEWVSRSYRLPEHIARIGERFENLRDDGERGHDVFDVSDAQLQKILSDPNVAFVREKAYGSFNVWGRRSGLLAKSSIPAVGCSHVTPFRPPRFRFCATFLRPQVLHCNLSLL